MGVVTGAAPFNGGTITRPLQIDGNHLVKQYALLLVGDSNQFGLNYILECQGTADPSQTLLGLSLKGDLQVYPSQSEAAAGDPVLELGALAGGGNAFQANNDGTTVSGLTSTAIGTQQYVSGAGAIVGGSGVDTRTFTPVTFNPTAGAAATCAVAVSPTGAVYTTLWTETEPAGVAFDGTVHAIKVFVPASWRLKLTTVNATLGLTTYY